MVRLFLCFLTEYLSWHNLFSNKVLIFSDHYLNTNIKKYQNG